MWYHGMVPLDRGTTNNVVPWLYLLDGKDVGILVAEVKETAEVNGLRSLVGVLHIGVAGLLVFLAHSALEACEPHYPTKGPSLR